MSEQTLEKTHRSHVGLILIIGFIVIAATAGVGGWVTGYLKPKDKVALVTWNDDPYWDLVISGAQAAANADNLDLTVIRSQPDEKVQSQHIRDLLDQGVKAIAISPNNPTDQADLLNEVADKAVLVTFDSDAPTAKRKGFVGTDNYAAGQLAAEEVRNAIPDGGDVIISVGNAGMINGRDRRQGLIDNLIDRRPKEDRPADPVDGELKGSHYSIVATLLDGGDPAKATTAATDAIKSHPNVKCIVGLFSYSAPAIVQAIDQAGKTGQIKVIGFDETDATQADVTAGTIYSSILQDQYRCGYEAVNLMADSLRGTDVDAPTGVRFIHLRTWVMKPDNLADLRADKMVHTPK